MARGSSIADIFFAFRGEDKELLIDAAKAGDAAGQTLGERLSAAAKQHSSGLKVLGGAATALFGIVAKGGNDLANTMADFRAETGATEEEAAAAQKTLVGLYKTNTDGFDTLGKVLAVVHNDMGLVGEDAKKAAQLVLDFAHATGIDAVDAARRLDDVSDAYNLTADQQRDILDKLVLSHQRYGGEISSNLDTLIHLAPALKAANLSYDDGIGLLNLFAKSGVDADTAVKGLQTALTKVKSPAELQALITDIAKTEDPSKRAAKAVDLFGVKAGYQLSQALAGSTGDLRDFTPAVQEAAGATAAAGDVIENKFTNRLKILFHSLTGNLDSFASGFEPIIATLAYLPKAVNTVTAVLGFLILRNNQATISAIAASIATRAQAIGYLLLHPQFLLTAIQLGLLAVAQGIYTAATWLATAATTALGVAVDLLLGPVGLIILAVGLLFVAWQTNFLGIRDIVGNVVGWIIDKLGFLFPILKAVGDAIGAVLGFISDAVGTIAGAVGGAVDALTNAGAQATELTGKMRDDIVGDLTRSKDDVYDAASRMGQAVPDAIAAQEPAVAAAAAKLPPHISAALVAEQPDIDRAARDAIEPIGRRLWAMGPIARLAAANVFLDAAAGLRSKRDNIRSALDTLKQDIRDRMNPGKRIAFDIAALIGRQVAHGLHDSDPVVKKQAEGTRALLENELIETIKAGGKAGEKIQEELERKLHSKDPAVREQARRTKSVIDEALKAQPTKSPGDVIGDQLNADLGHKGTPLGKTAYQLGRTIALNIIAGVKGTGQVGSQVTEPTTGVVPVGGSYASGITRVPFDQLAYIHQDEAVLNVPQAQAYRAAGLGGGAPLVGVINVDARGHKDEAGIVRAVKQTIEESMAQVNADQSIRGYMGTTP